MKQAEQFEQHKKDLLNSLYNLILSEDITAEERRVITKAKGLIEQGEYVVVVIRRLERTLAIKSMSEKRSPKVDDLYKILPDLIYNFTIYPYTYCILGRQSGISGGRQFARKSLVNNQADGNGGSRCPGVRFYFLHRFAVPSGPAESL